jgi:hypothetical protein
MAVVGLDALGAREEKKRGIRHKNGGWRFGYLLEITSLPKLGI